MVDIQSVAAEIRRGKKRKIEDRKKSQGKNIMAPLLHMAAIINDIRSASRFDTVLITALGSELR